MVAILQVMLLVLVGALSAVAVGAADISVLMAVAVTISSVIL
jgi:hypothetical protein